LQQQRGKNKKVFAQNGCRKCAKYAGKQIKMAKSYLTFARFCFLAAIFAVKQKSECAHPAANFA
jgi:hypothetical protein